MIAVFSRLRQVKKRRKSCCGGEGNIGHGGGMSRGCMYVCILLFITSRGITEVCLDSESELPHRPSRAVTTGGQSSSIVKYAHDHLTGT